jgi:hypothetical protein
MTRTRHWRLLSAGIVLGFGLLAKAALGYIDPGTGSYVLQIAIAFLVGVAFSVKVFWKKISAFLRKAFSGKKGSGRDVT